MAGVLIRQLTEVEKKCTAKYRAQLGAAHQRAVLAQAEVTRLRAILSDMAIAFSGREEAVTMTEDALYEPQAPADGS